VNLAPLLAGGASHLECARRETTVPCIWQGPCDVTFHKVDIIRISIC